MSCRTCRESEHVLEDYALTTHQWSSSDNACPTGKKVSPYDILARVEVSKGINCISLKLTSNTLLFPEL